MLADGPFVPHVAGGVMDDVDRRWEQLCCANPAFYDGRLCHVLSVLRNGSGGAVIHAVDCAYRFHAVQDHELDLGIRPLGVKGVTSRDGRVLMGRRSQAVATYQGLWEFAPGGAVEPGREPIDVVVAELEEETSLRASGRPTPLAILYDPIVRTWEIVYQLTPESGALIAAPAEYEELAWFAAEDLPEGLSPVARQMTALL